MDKTQLYIQGWTQEASKHSSHPKSTQVTLVTQMDNKEKKKTGET